MKLLKKIENRKLREKSDILIEVISEFKFETKLTRKCKMM